MSAAEPIWASKPAPHPLRRATDWPVAGSRDSRAFTPRMFPERARAHAAQRGTDRIKAVSHVHRPAPRRAGLPRSAPKQRK